RRQQGGFGVLVSFAQADFQNSNERNRKPIFLAETSFRSLLYASREWAGGETTRALRLALSDLYEYLNNATFRKQAVAETWKSLRNCTPESVPPECVPRGTEQVSFHFIRLLWHHFNSFGWRVGLAGRPGVEPVAYTDDWLRSRLLALDSVCERCENLL